MNAQRRLRRLEIATAAGGAALVAFWTLYLLANDRLGLVESQYVPFEGSFVFADLLLALLLFAASASLHRRRAEAPFLTTMAASMCLYLGILDGTFYARNGLLLSPSVNGVVELSIVAACVGGGLYALQASWTIWKGDLVSAAREEDS